MSAQVPQSNQPVARPANGGAYSPSGGWLRRIVITALVISGLLTFGYVGVSSAVATQLVYAPQLPVTTNPGQKGLTYTPISFPARTDGVQLQGWVIPGVLPNGHLTDDRIIILVHGTRRNRTDEAAGLLNLSADIARHGFAVLAFDLRGEGESQPAPLSMGHYEQRDVLGAVDFIQHGGWPYPELGRPRVIGGWGVSLGAATLLFASSQEPAIRAVVSDCAYADILPIFQREIVAQGHVPAVFNPGVLLAAQLLYGTNFYDVRPVDIVAKIAPRPLLLIHGTADNYIPPENMAELYAAASAAPNAHVEQWSVPGAKHAQSFNVEGAVYVRRVTDFFNTALGPDQSGA